MRKMYSINSSIILILLLCFLLPFLFQTVQVSGSMSRLVEDKVVHMAYKNMENSALYFANAIQDQFDMANYYKRDAVIMDAAAQMNQAGEAEMYQIQQELIVRLERDNYREQYRYPFYFMLFDYQGNMTTSYTHTPYGGYEELYEEITESSWFLNLKESYTDSAVMFSGRDLLNEWGTDKFYVAANVFYEGNNQGILVIATDKGFLHSQFYDVLPGAVSFIVNQREECVAGSPEGSIHWNSDVAKQVEKDAFNAGKGEENGIGSIRLKEGKKENEYAVMQSPIIVKGYPHEWKMITLVPAASIMEDVEQVRISNRAVLILYLAAVVGMILLLKKTIVKPVLSLHDLVRRVQEGNLQVKAENLPNNELGELGRGFNRMVEELNTSFQNVKRVEEEKRRTEIGLLQNQIKPHFVRNVLNTIRWLAEINGASSVSKSIMALTSLLEYNFRDSELISTVRDEINYVQKYVYLQELRFQNKFRDEYDVEEQLYHAPILKLTFQPIVENCIYHGILAQEGLGIIRIKGRQFDKVMEFTISDNGVGMDGEKAAQILLPPSEEGIYENSRMTENIALWNIDQRIKRKYGSFYGLTIESVKGEGTSVILRVPFEEGREEAHD